MGDDQSKPDKPSQAAQTNPLFRLLGFVIVVSLGVLFVINDPMGLFGGRFKPLPPIQVDPALTNMGIRFDGW
jgi:hypothetical protein